MIFHLFFFISLISFLYLNSLKMLLYFFVTQNLFRLWARCRSVWPLYLYWYFCDRCAAVYRFKRKVILLQITLLCLNCNHVYILPLFHFEIEQKWLTSMENGECDFVCCLICWCGCCWSAFFSEHFTYIHSYRTVVK